MLLEMSESIAVHFIFQHEYVEFLNAFRNSINNTARRCPSEILKDIELGGEIVAQSCSRQVGRGTIMIDDKNRDVYEYIALFACQWVMVERSIVPHDWYDARPQHTRHEPPRVQMRATRYFYAFSDPFIDPLAVLFLHHYHQREIFRSRAKSNDKKRSKIATRNSKRKFERSSFQLRDSRMYE